MRKQFLETIWALLAITAMAGAQTSGMAANAALQKVAVSRGSGEISVEITARGAVAPKVETLAAPARIVVDLPNTTMATSLNHIRVGSDGVTGIRVGTDATETTRVVVDLEHLCKYELLPASGNKLVLKLETGSSSQPTLASKNGTSPVSSAPVQVATAQISSATSNTKNVAKEFQFVEPAYTPKKEATPVDPAVRSADAASKFVERPEGNLLPNTNAAMQASSQSTPSSTSSEANTPAVQPVPVQPAPVQPAVNLAAEQRSHQQSTSSGPKYTGEPISVNLKDVDLKDFFRLIHEISGLNVVLDPDVKGSLTIVLDDVPWDQALDIVLKNNDLARQLDGNVLRIATVDTMRREADARRAAQEAEAMAVEKVTVTRFLSYAHSKDVVATIKKFLSQRGDIVSDDRTNAIIISDIPTVIPAVDRLIQQLDRKTQEVEIEARVVSATRSFARDIGTQLGFGFGNSATAVGGASAVGTSPTSAFNTPGAMYPIIGTSAPKPGTGVQIPLFSNLGVVQPTSGFSFINASNAVRIDAILTMAESRGLLKILSRPRVVTQNNIQAIVKQGVRIPIESAATLSSPPTITYVDAFLKLTVTPQITVENTIFLNVDVENTTPDFSQQINGNPTLITQQATTQVLVTDGGTVVIGGVIQTNNSMNVAQVPLLGSIPWLGNLFKHQTVNSSSQELIFFITPRVIET
jgi:type IV pilus assembly protein PilQ